MQAEKLEKMIESILSGENMELVELKLKGTSIRPLIKVFIDKPGGVAVRDCENISRQFSALLDIEEEGDYILEVSSPGVDRPLNEKKDFLKAVNRNVKVIISEKDDKTRTLSGTVINASENSFSIEVKGKKEIEEIPYSIIVKAVIEVAF